MSKLADAWRLGLRADPDLRIGKLNVRESHQPDTRGGRESIVTAMAPESGWASAGRRLLAAEPALRWGYSPWTILSPFCQKAPAAERNDRLGGDAIHAIQCERSHGRQDITGGS
jgi:hypothetical protein